MIFTVGSEIGDLKNKISIDDINIILCTNGIGYIIYLSENSEIKPIGKFKEIEYADLFAEALSKYKSKELAHV
jgi:hypothetical protein